MSDNHDISAPRRPDSPSGSSWLRLCAWLSFVAAVAAWICLTWQGYVAIGVAVVALVLAVIALKLRRSALRNLAITSIIASIVLLVVVISFVTVLSLVLKTTV